MATIQVKNASALGTVYASRKKGLRETLNKNLYALAEDWKKTSSNTFVHKGGKAAFDKITEVTPLSRETGGTRGTIKAKITLEIQAIPLTDFTVVQQRMAKNNSLTAAEVRKGRYKEKPIEIFHSPMQTFTKAKILKQGSVNQVIPRKKKGTLSSAEGIHGFMYSPKNRVNAKSSTPLGVYVRLQAATWKNGKRLPTYKIYAPPLAIVMLAPRVLKRIKFEKRIRGLLDD